MPVWRSWLKEVLCLMISSTIPSLQQQKVICTSLPLWASLPQQTVEDISVRYWEEASVGRSCFAAGISNLHFSWALMLNNISYCVTASSIQYLISAAYQLRGVQLSVPWIQSHFKDLVSGVTPLVAFGFKCGWEAQSSLFKLMWFKKYRRSF